jgi:hypothetical protein
MRVLRRAEEALVTDGVTNMANTSFYLNGEVSRLA